MHDPHSSQPSALCAAATPLVRTPGGGVRPVAVARRPAPVVKWAGGKQALAAHLVGFFPPRFGTYYEPFLGGASVLLALHPERAIVGDRNGWLMDTYEALCAPTGKRLPACSMGCRTQNRITCVFGQRTPPISTPMPAPPCSCI